MASGQTKKPAAVSPLTPQQLKSRLPVELPTWNRDDGVIERTYKTGDWAHTLMLVNAIGFVCEAAFHHPDLLVSYAKVTVRLSTHEPRGITDKDFELAREIERAALWVPTEGQALDGYEKAMKKPLVE